MNVYSYFFFFIYLDLFSNNAFRWLSSAFYFPRFWMKDSSSVFSVKVKSREKLLSIFLWRAEVSWPPGGTGTDVYACAAYMCDLCTRGTKNVTVPWSKATLSISVNIVNTPPNQDKRKVEYQTSNIDVVDNPISWSRSAIK